MQFNRFGLAAVFAATLVLGACTDKQGNQTANQEKPSPDVAPVSTEASVSTVIELFMGDGGLSTKTLKSKGNPGQATVPTLEDLYVAKMRADQECFKNLTDSFYNAVKSPAFLNAVQSMKGKALANGGKLEAIEVTLSGSRTADGGPIPAPADGAPAPAAAPAELGCGFRSLMTHINVKASLSLAGTQKIENLDSFLNSSQVSKKLEALDMDGDVMANDALAEMDKLIGHWNALQPHTAIETFKADVMMSKP